MRNTPNVKAERYRVAGDSSMGNNGAFAVPVQTDDGRRVEVGVIVSDGELWDHVSVSLPHRDPSWSEMCQVKELFFRDDEVVMQLHPARDSYVNNHRHCLHLWRPRSETVPSPPSYMVGSVGDGMSPRLRRLYAEAACGVPGAADQLAEEVGAPPSPAEDVA